MKYADKISIIVPIYNVGKYIDNGIASICGQTYDNLEILLIDDGSTDDSGAICDAWAKKDTRIRVFHIENGGQSRARNIGLEHATGDYIGFVDGDDAAKPQMYEVLWKLMQEKDADIAECNFQGRKSKEPDEMEQGMTIVLTGREALRQHLDMRIPSRFPSTSVWSKLFRKEIIGKLRFPEGRIHEEYGFLCKALYGCKRLVYHNERLYVRTLREDSTTAAAFSLRAFDKLEVYKERDAFLESVKEEELLKLSFMQRYDLMLHYYNECIKYGMKKQAGELLAQLATEREKIKASQLPVKRKCLILLLVYLPKIYDTLWKSINRG